MAYPWQRIKGILIWTRGCRSGHKFVEENISWDNYGRNMELVFEDAVFFRKTGAEYVRI